MPDLGNISRRIEALRRLADKEVIFLDDVGDEFRNDLQYFVTGETMILRDGKLVIGRPLYKRWLDKVRNKGFDYEIDFK